MAIPIVVPLVPVVEEDTHRTTIARGMMGVVTAIKMDARVATRCITTIGTPIVVTAAVARVLATAARTLMMSPLQAITIWKIQEGGTQLPPLSLMMNDSSR